MLSKRTAEQVSQQRERHGSSQPTGTWKTWLSFVYSPLYWTVISLYGIRSQCLTKGARGFSKCQGRGPHWSVLLKFKPSSRKQLRKQNWAIWDWQKSFDVMKEGRRKAQRSLGGLATDCVKLEEMMVGTCETSGDLMGAVTISSSIPL